MLGTVSSPTGPWGQAPGTSQHEAEPPTPREKAVLGHIAGRHAAEPLSPGLRRLHAPPPPSALSPGRPLRPPRPRLRASPNSASVLLPHVSGCSPPEAPFRVFPVVSNSYTFICLAGPLSACVKHVAEGPEN